MVGDTGCVSSSGDGDGQYYAAPARRSDGAIVAVAIPFLWAGFSLTRAIAEPSVDLEPSPYYSTAVGRAESYLATVRERSGIRGREGEPTVQMVERLAEALRCADGGDRSRLDALTKADLEYVTEQLVPTSLESTDAYVRRGGELLRELAPQAAALRTRSVPSVRFSL